MIAADEMVVDDIDIVGIELLSLDGKVIGRYRSVTSCSDCVGIAVDVVRDCCVNGGSVGGMKFRFEIV